MSGAYGNRFLAPGFCWHAGRTIRKIFHDEEQADHYHRGHDRAARGRFLSARPLWEAVLARQAGVLPFDPFRENTLLDVQVDDAWFEKLELTLAPGADADAIRAALKAAAPEFTGEGDADFRNPIAAVRWGETFGLYVGMTAEATAEVAQPLERRLNALLEKLWPLAAAKTAELGLKKPVAKKLGQDDPVRAFNPWGPLSDERFMRESFDVGSVDIRIAFVPVRDERYFIGEWFKSCLP